ncbi:MULTISPECIES: ABC transporter permease [Streptomyces]|nr:MULTISPECIES: ABC transporter permease [Streptomyces]NNG85590.1 ABC transporter permease subunit [Streptomyces cacaoi]QHF97874.1 ABC transporter permease [Streptomyces sp. NHF165]
MHDLRRLLSAEWSKMWTGRAWWSMALIGVLMGALAGSGYVTEADKDIAKGATTIEGVTDQVVRSWFMMLLFSALLGAIFVSREYQSGAIGRSVLLSGGRGRLLTAKLLVGLAMGVVFGALTVALAAASPSVFLPQAQLEPAWTHETTLTLIGVFVVTTLGAPWGVLLGWIIRNQAATVATLLGLTLFVDEALLRLAPAVGKFTLTIAMSSVYRDGKPELLSVPAASLTIAAWLVAAGIAARALFHKRDVL